MASQFSGPAGGTRRVAFLTVHGWPWFRQTDNGAGNHGALIIGLEPSPTDDWIVVFDDLHERVHTHVPKDRRILFVTEPPGQKVYRPQFANQFGVIVSPYRITGYRGRWIASQSALSWFYGVDFAGGTLTSRIDLNALRNLSIPPDKQKRISVVCSTKSKLPGHRARLKLLQRLTAEFPDAIDVFGRGFRPIGDKAESIAPYRYHLVMENNDCPHFWTEKLADAYLGYSLPIFVGCGNVTDYFPERSLVRVPDVSDHDAVVRLVGDLLQADPWKDRLEAIVAARTMLIERYNIFCVIARLTEGPRAEPQSRIRDTIWPGKQCGALHGLVRAAKEMGGRLTGAAARP